MTLKELPMKVGLTGGIASGKSTTQRFFEELKIPCIDHDLIAREVVQKGTDGLQQLVEEFGSIILSNDGQLNRPKLREIIFADQHLRKKVEDIIHPLVFSKSEEIRNNARNSPYILIVSPLLIESGSAKSMFKLIVVDIPESVQLSRLLERDKLSIELAQSIIRNQATRQQRLEAADFVLNNNQDLKKLQQEVQECHKTLINLIDEHRD